MPADPVPENSVTGDNERQAEIEAVLSAVGSPECNCRSKAEAALDRVRDARRTLDEGPA